MSQGDTPISPDAILLTETAVNAWMAVVEVAVHELLALGFKPQDMPEEQFFITKEGQLKVTISAQVKQIGQDVVKTYSLTLDSGAWSYKQLH